MTILGLVHKYSTRKLKLQHLLNFNRLVSQSYLLPEYYLCSTRNQLLYLSLYSSHKQHRQPPVGHHLWCKLIKTEHTKQGLPMPDGCHCWPCASTLMNEWLDVVSHPGNWMSNYEYFIRIMTTIMLSHGHHSVFCYPRTITYIHSFMDTGSCTLRLWVQAPSTQTCSNLQVRHDTRDHQKKWHTTTTCKASVLHCV